MTSDEQKKLRDAGAVFPVDEYATLIAAAQILRGANKYGYDSESLPLAIKLEAMAKRIYPGCFKP